MNQNEKTSLETLLAELKQNFRLRMGMWSIVIIVLFYSLIVQSERVDVAFSGFAQQVDRLLRAQALLEQDDWLGRAEEEELTFAEVSSRLWQAETLGLAQASLQATLGDMTRNLTLQNIRMRSGTAQAMEGVIGVWQVQVQLEARYNPGDELGLLYRMAQSPRLMVIERLDLQPGNRRLSLIVSGYFTGLEVEAL